MRLIDADALKDAIRTDIMGGLNYERFIDDAPIIDAVPVLHGHWVFNERDHMFYCSNCKNGCRYDHYPYCHWCGAIMDEVTE